MQVPILDNHIRLDPRKGRNIEEFVPHSRSHSRRRSFPLVFSESGPNRIRRRHTGGILICVLEFSKERT